MSLGRDSRWVPSLYEHFGVNKIRNHAKRTKRISRISCWAGWIEHRRGADHHRRRTCWTLHSMCYSCITILFGKHFVLANNSIRNCIVKSIVEISVVYFRRKLNQRHSSSMLVRSCSRCILGSWLVPTIPFEISSIYGFWKYSLRCQLYVEHLKHQIWKSKPSWMFFR